MTTRAMRPRVCRACGRNGELISSRCRACDEAWRMVRLGPCTLCATQGISRAAYARGLCKVHHRNMMRKRVVEATGYVGNAENRDDYNALVECLITRMLALTPAYGTYLHAGVGFHEPDVQTMQQYLLLARCGLRPAAYTYLLRRVNTALPPGAGIPLPRGVYETTPAQTDTPEDSENRTGGTLDTTPVS